MLTTKADWITALTKAKKEALRLYPSWECISRACADNEIVWISFLREPNCRCGPRPLRNYTRAFMDTNPTRAEVAAVFDRSIEAGRCRSDGLDQASWRKVSLQAPKALRNRGAFRDAIPSVCRDCIQSWSSERVEKVPKCD